MATLIPTQPGRLSRPMVHDPLTSLHEEVNQLINDFFDQRNGGDLRTVVTPSTDLSETDDAFQLQMDLPGIDAKHIDIKLRDNVVTVCGERKAEEKEEGKSFHRTERHRGRFSDGATPRQRGSRQRGVGQGGGGVQERHAAQERRQSHTAGAGEGGVRYWNFIARETCGRVEWARSRGQSQPVRGVQISRSPRALQTAYAFSSLLK